MSVEKFNKIYRANLEKLSSLQPDKLINNKSVDELYKEGTATIPYKDTVAYKSRFC